MSYSQHYPKPGGHPVTDDIVRALNEFTTYSAFAVALGAFLLGSQKKMREPWVKPAVRRTLDVMREDAFASQGTHLQHYQRVTLFKARWFCWRACLNFKQPFGTWLVPFSRSGPIERSAAHFRVPSDPDRAEGIAGSAFARDMTMVVENLPNVTKSNIGEKALLHYAKNAFVDVEWVREKRPKSRSLIGLPVRVNGKVWGVLVLDTRDAHFTGYQSIIKSVQLGSRLLTTILERN